MTVGYNVFISWSGDRSRVVADFLRGWLPKLVQAAKPWMSDTDIEKGARGLDEVAKALVGMKFGISCLTPENLDAPWLLFEAGALSKTIDDKTRLCTYLLGNLEAHHVKAPLGIFQATRALKEDTRKLVQTINRAVSEDPVKHEYLDELFDAMWPKLDKVLSDLPRSEPGAEPRRSLEDMVAEILEINRADAGRRRKTEHLDAYMPLLEELFPAFQELLRTARKPGVTGVTFFPGESTTPPDLKS